MDSKIKSTSEKGLECLNCGQPLRGNENFCPDCGQINDTRKISIKEIVSHFFGGFFAFDNLFFKTLKPLLLKPGKVSKEYVEGKRKSYTNPFIFLLHSAIIYFLLIGILSFISHVKNYQTEIRKKAEIIKFENLTKEKILALENYVVLKDSTINAEEKKLLVQRLYSETLQLVDTLAFVDKPDNDGPVKVNIQNNKLFEKFNHQLESLHLDVTLPNNYLDSVMNIPQIDSIIKASEKKRELQPNSFFKKIQKFTDYSQKNPDTDVFTALSELKEKPTKGNLYLYHKIGVFKDFNNQSFSDLLNLLLSKIPMSLFFMLPLVALVFSLVYVRHSHTFTEHLIVVFNLQSAFFWIIMLMTLTQYLNILSGLISAALYLYFLYYLYKTLRIYYQQNRFKTIVKFSIISIFYFFIAIFGFIILFFITLIFNT